MTRHVRTISPRATMEEAAKLMRSFRIGSLVVVEGKRPMGIVTERDVTYKLVAEDLDASTNVKDIMVTDLKFVDADTELKEAAKVMASHAIKRLLVKEEEELKGIITTTDILNVEKVGEDPSKYTFT